MGISQISLTTGMRANLLSLNGTKARSDRTQERLATGKKVNSALDNPTNFFASIAHLNRAEGLNSRKDGMREAIQTGKAADAGMRAISALIDTALGLANAGNRASMSDKVLIAAQFNDVIKQINSLAGDSGYRGTNLLKKDHLTVYFDEEADSNLTISGIDSTLIALGVSKIGMPNNTVAGGGESHSLAVKQDGTVVAWGSVGPETVVPPTLTDVRSVSAGCDFSLALKNDGSVVAWGVTNYDQTAVPLSAKSGVVAIAAGWQHSLALKSDGSVVAWGDNVPLPMLPSGAINVPVAAQSGVVSISAGSGFSVALKNDGSVIAWGNNTAGKINIPAAAQSGVVGIAAGTSHTLALKSDGSVIAWGDGSLGQMPVPAEAQSDIVAIAGGGGHSLALKSDGTVIAWGWNNKGQATVPPGLTDVVAVSAGFNFSLALKSDGTIVAWGAPVPTAAPPSNIMPSDVSWLPDSGVTTSEEQLEAAKVTLRSNSATLSSCLSVIAIRQDFTQQIISTLQAGSDILTLADMNEEAANLLMLQTRQNMEITSLTLANDSSQSIMRLF